MPVHTDTISAWLSRFEGRELTAYVPCQRRNDTGRAGRTGLAVCGPVIGASGVTIGSGLDLGQQRLADLERMNIPPELRQRFRPYLGKRREAARAALAAAPLAITEAQCAALDAAVHGDYIRRAGAVYESRAGNAGGAPFAHLPPQAQTVIVSLHYHLGRYDGDPGYPVLWGHLIRNDWASAARELQTGFRRFASRRAREGRLLAELC